VPTAGYRLLVLDDILIGLDMTNRIKMIDLIHEYFSDWQILIFTYSKAWFERLKDRVEERGKFPDWAAPWESVVLWEEWRDEEKSPRVVAEGSGDLLEMAARHLRKRDYTAAAVYARKALEALCYRICAKASLSVLHIEFPKQRKVEHFLSVLTPRLEEVVDDTRRPKALELLARLEQARAFVLNRNAHFDVEEEDTLSAEVGTALEVVEDLTAFLAEQSWAGETFHSGRKLTALEQMNAQLAAARALAAKGAKRQCQAAMKLGHGFFWQAYGATLGVLLPLGVEIAASAIWKAADEQTKVPADVKARLDAAKGYLFGSVKVDKFDAAEFEEAAKLLEEFAAPSPPSA
jgi:HEPN domain-containing protein